MDLAHKAVVRKWINMEYKIIGDSSLEFRKEYEGDDRFASVALSIDVGDYHIKDDENFNQAELLKKIAETTDDYARSACPAPGVYYDAYVAAKEAGAKHIYVITLSSQLSGSYASAMAGADMFKEDFEDFEIHVVDSRTASCGQLQICDELIRLEEAKLPFNEIVEKIETYRDNVVTYFVLDNLDTFIKSGRIKGIAALAVSKLNIRPVLRGVDGKIAQKDIGRGNKMALRKMVEHIVKDLDGDTSRTLMITHCNTPERAEAVKEMLLEQATFKGVVILEMRGISSMYANDGGVIVTV